MLAARNIVKSYEGDPVLDGVSISIAQGEFVSLVGRSGSGKTTFLKIISGLLDPDAGEVIFNDETLPGPKDRLVAGHEQIKMVHQDYPLKHKMTIEENLNYAMLGYDPDYVSRRIPELIELCHLSELKDRLPNELSGGQRQRVAFACALSTQPELIVMDEPFSNLDPYTKQVLLQETRHLAKATDTSILLVTHDTRDAMEAADRIDVLIDGRIRVSDTPQGLYKNPQTPEIAGFFGLFTEFSVTELERLGLKPSGSASSYGMWAEDVQLREKGSLPGKVIEVIFAGAHNKLLLDLCGSEVYACDYPKRFSSGDLVNVDLLYENLMIFNES